MVLFKAFLFFVILGYSLITVALAILIYRALRSRRIGFSWHLGLLFLVFVCVWRLSFWLYVGLWSSYLVVLPSLAFGVSLGFMCDRYVISRVFGED